ncbi:C-GCAxxG-C-C family protein [Gaoshiqia sp. Z1-71]|uniref:C-GCAxxG-C-C family protein n=1 Tax=Gaoshiqia hydrogeniformans TaxID=3290090 RepID=UPI003BF7AF41
MDKAQLAIEVFRELNCSQSVLSAFANDLNLDQETALKIASGFGGGMACGETCGAVTGAYMVIGLKHGHSSADPDAKAATKEKIRRFSHLFTQTHGSLVCKELLGINISTPEGNAEAKERDLFQTHCPRFIETACRIIEKEF